MTEVADRLVPQPKVEQEFDRTSMSLWRWLRDPELGFPQPIKIRNRNFWLRSDLDAFKRRMVDEALRSRSDAAAMRAESEACRDRQREPSLKREQTA